MYQWQNNGITYLFSDIEFVIFPNCFKFIHNML